MPLRNMVCASNELLESGAKASWHAPNASRKNSTAIVTWARFMAGLDISKSSKDSQLRTDVIKGSDRRVEERYGASKNLTNTSINRWLNAGVEKR